MRQLDNQAKDCFCKPESENYKGDQYVKDLIAKKQEALQKAVRASALTGEVGQTAGAAAASSGGSLDGGMSLDNAWKTLLQAKQEVRSGNVAIRLQYCLSTCDGSDDFNPDDATSAVILR